MRWSWWRHHWLRKRTIWALLFSMGVCSAVSPFSLHWKRLGVPFLPLKIPRGRFHGRSGRRWATTFGFAAKDHSNSYRFILYTPSAPVASPLQLTHLWPSLLHPLSSTHLPAEKKKGNMSFSLLVIHRGKFSDTISMSSGAVWVCSCWRSC